MKPKTMPPPSGSSRRALLRLLAGAAGAGGLAAGFGPGTSRPVQAATDDYKALVCVFLYGGNDGQNMVVARDATRHAQYAAVRGALALPRERLVPLDADHGLHPAMAALAPAWADGALSAQFNVGPLFAPLSKAAYLAAAPDDPLIPASLFSHSDQQTLWEAASTDSLERTGWGGRAAAVAGMVNPVISFGGNARFGLSELGAPWALPGPGAGFGPAGFADWAPVQARRRALEAIQNENQGAPLAEAYAKARREAFDLQRQLQGIFDFDPNVASDPTGVVGAFQPLMRSGKISGALAPQLYQVARFIARRQQVKGQRQIFFVQLGGFDTHADQIGGQVLEGLHAELLGQLAASLAAFWRALGALGMGERVTLFTASDFGRTFAPNESRGTDHAWGNHQLLLGGAVQGRRLHGTFPSQVLGGPDDVGRERWEQQGRWIPSASVDQYAATLLRWLGLSEAQLDATLPNLRNFGSARDLGFMRA